MMLSLDPIFPDFTSFCAMDPGAPIKNFYEKSIDFLATPCYNYYRKNKGGYKPC